MFAHFQISRACHSFMRLPIYLSHMPAATKLLAESGIPFRVVRLKECSMDFDEYDYLVKTAENLDIFHKLAGLRLLVIIFPSKQN